jgi:hypothetical protein
MTRAGRQDGRRLFGAAATTLVARDRELAGDTAAARTAPPATPR